MKQNLFTVSVMSGSGQQVPAEVLDFSFRVHLNGLVFLLVQCDPQNFHRFGNPIPQSRCSDGSIQNH